MEAPQLVASKARSLAATVAANTVVLPVLFINSKLKTGFAMHKRPHHAFVRPLCREVRLVLEGIDKFDNLFASIYVPPAPTGTPAGQWGSFSWILRAESILFGYRGTRIELTASIEKSSSSVPSMFCQGLKGVGQ